ncbi:winged helix-turn-helix domain-containing protein [Amycolatopsis endophytica]|uniref:DNA-binding transcriptional ArsR family regulator n=1 Tax=Amycolatopsis endophytica TaxID=860233 RepID=A0A853B552_9PSEU|nr:winged helix-turn-helix domain-containing protein [Amycolatopsis endophytica]NYI90130.1 DNA-binding transcriptional ArsR family regulator [Amycolatopsis endophytica]
MRLELKPRDLTRVGLAGDADPCLELACSVRVLGGDDGGFGWWRRGLRLPESFPVLRWLYSGEVAEFLLPACADFASGLASILETPPDRVRSALAGLPRTPGLPAWAADLRSGDDAALSRLVQALREYFAVALAPHWDTVRARVEADRRARVRALAENGVDGLLATLRPMLRWDPPYLVTGVAGPQLPRGRAGVLLVPVCFTAQPWIVPGAGPVRLAYPASAEDPRVRRARPTPPRALSALLGPTRAAAMTFVAAGCSTTDLAARLGVTPSAASKHMSVLRAAGLIASHRNRNTVRHSLTALGLALVEGAST